MVLVEARALGKKRPLIEGWSVDLPPIEPEGGGGGLTLRQLIAGVVRAEVAAFKKRQRERRLLRVLSQREIEAGRRRGKIEMGGRDLEQEVDPEAAVGVALAAFEDGLYLVFVDGQEKRELDEQVYVNRDSRLLFLRLTFLAGA